MRYYVLFVEGDVFPCLEGPFKSGRKRNEEARRLKREKGDESGIYWLNIDSRGNPETGAYTGEFFKEDEKERSRP